MLTYLISLVAVTLLGMGGAMLGTVAYVLCMTDKRDDREQRACAIAWSGLQSGLLPSFWVSAIVGALALLVCSPYVAAGCTALTLFVLRCVLIRQFDR